MRRRGEGRQSATLKTIDVTVSADGTITPAEPVTGPARAVLTLLVESPEPNKVTREAMAEPPEGLPRFASVDALKAELED